MNFEQAMFEYSLRAEEVKKAAATFVIEFEGGYATLDAPRYYKDAEGTIDTVKRAWERYCNGDKDKLYGITSLYVRYEGMNDESKYIKNKRISA